MPKDATKNIDRYKIRGGQLNEFDFQKNQEEFAEASKPEGNLIPGTPPEQRDETVPFRGQPIKKAARRAAATKSTKSSPLKTGAKKSTKSAKTAKASKTSTVKAAAKKSTKTTKAAKASKTAKASKATKSMPRGATAKKLAARKAAKK